MSYRKTMLVVGVMLFSGTSTFAFASETALESILSDQRVSQRAMQDQANYLAYHAKEHQAWLRAAANGGKGAYTAPRVRRD